MAYSFNKVISQSIDMAGKSRVVVSVLDGKTDQWLMLKFQTKPTDTMIRDETNKQIYVLNNPSPKEPTIDDLKAIIVSKDAQIALLSKAVTN